jgi:hypothetical protein
MPSGDIRTEERHISIVIIVGRRMRRSFASESLDAGHSKLETHHSLEKQREKSSELRPVLGGG